MRAGRIRGLKAGLPETPAGTEQRIVPDMVLAVFGADGQARALQVPRHLARVRFEHLLDRGGSSGLLLEQHLPGDHLHLGIGELDGDAEAVAEPLQRLRPGRERRLTGGDQKQPALEPGLDSLRQLGDGRRPVLRLVDVLLDFVEDEDGQGEIAVGGERLPGGLHELVGRDVGLRRRELVEEELPCRLDVRGEGGVRFDQGLCDDGAHVEVVKLGLPAPARSFDLAPHLLQQPVVPQPEAESGLGVLLGEPARSEQDRQHGKPHVADVAPEQGPRGGHQGLADPPRAHLELPQRVLHFGGQPASDEASRRGPVVELRVDPQVGQHLEQMRLAAAEEPAHPHGVLPRGIEVGEIAFHDSLERVGEPAPADEGLQLVAQLPHDPRVRSPGDPGLAVVGQPDVQRVAVEEFVDIHGASSPWIRPPEHRERRGAGLAG